MNNPASSPTPAILDAAPDNWVDRKAPLWMRPYLRLMRADRPIGGWLLFWPCAWSAALAALAAKQPAPDVVHLVLFFVGSFVMRGAGCVWNDIVDRDIDARVARTAGRPLPSGQVSVKGAAAFLGLLLLLGLGVLLLLPPFAWMVGVAALLPVVTYPFMKRITWWPQVVLGLCFAWGALMGWAAAFGSLAAPALLLYLGAIFWVIGYDTIYALQDIEDDIMVGVHSTARLFGGKVRPILAGFYALAVLCIGAAVATVGAGPAGWLGAIIFAAHLGMQVWRLEPDNPQHCLSLFKANSRAGAYLFFALALEAALRTNPWQ